MVGRGDVGKRKRKVSKNEGSFSNGKRKKVFQGYVEVGSLEDLKGSGGGL